MKQFCHALCRLALCSVPLVLITACGESTAPGNESGASSQQASAQAAKRSKLSSYLGDNICAILPVAVLQEQFGAPAEVKAESSSSSSSPKCEYSWPRPDAEQRKKAMVEQMMQNMQRKEGERIKLDVRKMTSDFSIGVSLAESKSNPSTFVPVKLSEDQLQKKIDQATDAANKRLTDEQKKALGEHGFGNMAGNLMRRANERVVIDGVGEAAYWLPMMGGTLNVLEGGYQLSISPIIADDEAGNIEAARKIAAGILR